MERRVSLLLVEDEDVLRTLVAQFLRNEGFDVREARDGGEGVQAFLDHGPGRPDARRHQDARVQRRRGLSEGQGGRPPASRS